MLGDIAAFWALAELSEILKVAQVETITAVGAFLPRRYPLS
jgi:hypothetical protein